MVTPLDPTTAVNGEQQFTASSTDQFGNALSTSPSYSWSASAGSITSSGVFTAPAAAGNVTITASVAGTHGSTSVSVVSATTITVSAATDAALRAAIASANADAANGEAVTILFAASLAGDTIERECRTAGADGRDWRHQDRRRRSHHPQRRRQFPGLPDRQRRQVTLDGLTIEDGNAGSGSGGGIDNAGTLIITNSTLVDNTAGASGGGIDNTGSLTVTNITFTGNSAGANGGGIDNEQGGTLSVTQRDLLRQLRPNRRRHQQCRHRLMILDASFNGEQRGRHQRRWRRDRQHG